MLVGLFLLVVGVAAPAIALNASCCAPGSPCCPSPCCD
jgi:hypothetical protein